MCVYRAKQPDDFEKYAKLLRSVEAAEGVQLAVAAKSTHVIPIEMSPGDEIVWEFKVRSRSFSIYPSSSLSLSFALPLAIFALLLLLGLAAGRRRAFSLLTLPSSLSLSVPPSLLSLSLRHSSLSLPHTHTHFRSRKHKPLVLIDRDPISPCSCYRRISISERTSCTSQSARLQATADTTLG